MQLAELYRRVLDATKRETHSLKDELAICRAYLAIEKARFSDRLSFDITIDAGAETLVPVLALQPLVENAVKHGIAPVPRGGTIRIRTTQTDRMLSIAVEDNGAGLDAPTKLHPAPRSATYARGCCSFTASQRASPWSIAPGVAQSQQ